MRRALCVMFLVFVSASVTASNAIFELSGWAEIPSTYRHPGPVSGQFTAANNGVTPPYQGQPIPGFSGMIPSDTPGSFIALPDNGYGAQGNSADFVLGFYEVTPHFKTSGDGTTSRGPVTIHSFTPFSDPLGLLDASYITGGPVYGREFYYPTGAQIAVDPAIGSGRWLTGADFDVESHRDQPKHQQWFRDVVTRAAIAENRRKWTGGSGGAGSNPVIPTTFWQSIPERWVTPRSGDMGNTFAPKGFSIGSRRTRLIVEVAESYSMKPRSYQSVLGVTRQEYERRQDAPGAETGRLP